MVDSDFLDNMVQIRFNDYADAIASVWYSSVNGGSPDLEKFTREPNHDRSMLLQMLLSSSGAKVAESTKARHTSAFTIRAFREKLKT